MENKKYPFINWITEHTKNLANFLYVFFIYTAIAVIAGCISFFWLLKGIDTIFGTTLKLDFYLLLTANTTAYERSLFVVFFIILMSSISYVGTRFIEKLELIEKNEKKHIADFSNLVHQLEGVSGVRNKIVKYSHLMEIENNHECTDIYIITNDLEDDLKDEHFFKIIVENIKKGKNYKFLVPDMGTNRRDGCRLIVEIDKLNPRKKNTNILNIEVYLVQDVLFKICAFSDIAIYGANVKDSKPIGYAELPYISKSDDHLKRHFVELHPNVTNRMVQDIDSIIQNSKLISALSCDLDLSYK